MTTESSGGGAGPSGRDREGAQIHTQAHERVLKVYEMLEKHTHRVEGQGQTGSGHSGHRQSSPAPRGNRHGSSSPAPPGNGGHRHGPSSHRNSDGGHNRNSSPAPGNGDHRHGPSGHRNSDGGHNRNSSPAHSHGASGHRNSSSSPSDGRRSQNQNRSNPNQQQQRQSPSKQGQGRPKSASPQAGSSANANGTDAEVSEEERQLQSLRCPSERTEVISEREERRRKRCSDYPGLALGLGGSVFGSDTLMRFSLIRNELHNVINGQLKRMDGEFAALNRRLQLIEEDLLRSEVGLGEATTDLAAAAAAVDETEEIRSALENFSNVEDELLRLPPLNDCDPGAATTKEIV